MNYRVRGQFKNNELKKMRSFQSYNFRCGACWRAALFGGNKVEKLKIGYFQKNGLENSTIFIFTDRRLEKLESQVWKY